jgi:hypothetical protein
MTNCHLTRRSGAEQLIYLITTYLLQLSLATPLWKNFPAQQNFPSRPLPYIYSKFVSSSGVLALAG